MIVGIHQPNFLPWLGYFIKMYRSDVFVFLDDVQYPKGSVANRNKVVNNVGNEIWLTVPVSHKKGMLVTYNEMPIDYSQKWNSKMLNLVRASYTKSKYFSEVFGFFERMLSAEYECLSHLNITVIESICEKLNIQSKRTRSSVLETDPRLRDNKNLAICSALNATVYLSGQGGRKYMENEAFEERGITVEFLEFTHPVYAQLHQPFVPNLSIIDALFNLGFQHTAQMITAVSDPAVK